MNVIKIEVNSALVFPEGSSDLSIKEALVRKMADSLVKYIKVEKLDSLAPNCTDKGYIATLIVGIPEGDEFVTDLGTTTLVAAVLKGVIHET
jgi:hypothetical protein